MNHLAEIPRELLYIIISYSPDDPEALLVSLNLYPNNKIKNKIWELLYSFRFPDNYVILKHLINVDSSLRRSRDDERFDLSRIFRVRLRNYPNI
jgi:hypothetical protein